MLICCVKACRHKKKTNSCRLHRLPKNVKICKQWLRVIGDKDLLYRDVQTLNNTKYLCSCHFLDQDYRTPERKFLLSGAVPTQFSEQTHPIENESMKIFMSQAPLKTVAVLEPLADVTNGKAKTSRQSKKMPVYNTLRTAEDVQLSINNDDSNGLQSPVNNRRTPPDLDHETIKTSTNGVNPVKRLCTSKTSNGKSKIFGSHIKKLDNGLSCKQIDEKANSNQGNRDEESEITTECEDSPKILKNNLFKKLEQFCNLTKPPVVDALLYKIDLLLKYYDKPENYLQLRK